MKITVAGLGIRETKQLTLETLQVLRESKRVLVLPITGGASLLELQALIGKEINNIQSLYQEGAIDTDNYQNIIDATLKAGRDFGEVTLLVPGHPRIGVTLVNWLEVLKTSIGFELKVLPAISSFCTIINDLRFDPLERGTVMADANRLLLFQNHVDPCFNLLIYHLCSVGTPIVSRENPLRDNQLHLVKDFLARTYGADHRVVLISSSTGDGSDQVELSTTVAKLQECYPHIHYGTTLFVPSKNPSSMDHKFLSLLQGTTNVSA